MRAVITFHGIDERGGALSYAPKHFEALLAMLAAARMPVIDLDTLLAPATTRGVALTFDDGMRSVFDVALPVLRRHGARAHLFLSTGALEGAAPPAPRYAMLTWDMVTRLAESGVTIESHAHRHQDLRRLSDAEIDAECATADTLIEQRVGRRPRYFAYPYGYHDRRVAARIGPRYAAAFTTRLGFLSERDTPARLPRLDAHYLRGPFAHGSLTARSTRAYLLLRKILRKARGTE